MKADKAIATYRRMRAQPLWRLLASTTGPTVIGLLQSHLYEGERSLPASIFHERIARDLEELRAQGEDFPQTAQAYVASWLADGFLERRFPAGASEEEYELSTAAVEDEARCMRHCVDMFIPDCECGDYRVFSVQVIRTGERVATVGMINDDRVWIIDDIRGQDNEDVDEMVWALAERARLDCNSVDTLQQRFRF